MNSRHGREGLVGERPPHEIGIHAVRVGDNVGEHTIVFSTLGETLELVHKGHTPRQLRARSAAGGEVPGGQAGGAVYDEGRAGVVSSGNRLNTDAVHGSMVGGGIMSLPISVQQENGQYTATLLGAPDVQASAPAREEALC